MESEMRWFACLVVNKGLMTPDGCRMIFTSLQNKADPLQFGEKLLDIGVTDDVELLQKLLDEACTHVERGDPLPFDPFVPIKPRVTAPPMPEPEPEEPAAPPEPPPGEEPAVEPEPEAFMPTPAEAPAQAEAPAVEAPAAKAETPAAEAPDPLAAEEEEMDLASLVAALTAPPMAKRTPSAAPAAVGGGAGAAAVAAGPGGSAAGGAGQAGSGAGAGGQGGPAGGEPAARPHGHGHLHGAHKPKEPVVAADRAKAAMPDFGRLSGLGEEALSAAMMGLLKRCSQGGISDLHLSAAARPFERKDRDNSYLSQTVLEADVARRLNTCLLSREQRAFFDREKDYDFALVFSTGERYRVNLMVHKDGVAGTYRMVPTKIRPIADLGFPNPDVIKKMLSYHNGLILVTGPVGSGKTTTLASLVQEINNNREDHIITVEEPIEVVQVSNKCSVTQRAVGPHTNSFRSALKGALRQDPDIIVIGEMRDLETIEMAISASETGHLVIGTMHTSDASTTLNRLLDVFPPAQQSQIRAMVAESLRGVICQRLLPRKGGGVVMAYEILLRNLAVSALIREGKSQGLGNIMETGKADGMVLMDISIMQLWREGKIEAAVAEANLQNDMMKKQVKSGK